MVPLKYPIILASNSRARNDMLKNAGLNFTKIPADIDEDAVIKGATASPKSLALELAQQKALHISAQNSGAYVIGSDQILECEGALFQKANNADEARAKLKTLRGKTHHLHASVAIALNGEIIWHDTDTAKMAMHNFTDEFLETYLATAKDDITCCVGAYAFESHGAWLFDTIDANYFTILGMPLLPLLAFLNSGDNQ